MRIACIGDSITWHDGGSAAYPAVLSRLLGGGVAVMNAGVSGCTLLRQGNRPYWTEGRLPEVKAFGPDLIAVKLGTNDSKPINWRFRDAFAGDLRAFLDRLAGLPGSPRLVLCLPAPAWENGSAIDGAVIAGQIIPLILALAEERSLPVLDLHGPLLAHRDRFPDGVHPDEPGQAMLARLVHAGIAGMVTRK